MENLQRLQRALTLTREDIVFSLNLADRLTSQEAASTLLIAAQRLLSALQEAESVVERLEEELLSRGVILPQDSKQSPTVACETLLGWLRTEWTRRRGTRRRRDGPSSTDS